MSCSDTLFLQAADALGHLDANRHPAGRSTAVSYTHLDVYKRQLLCECEDSGTGRAQTGTCEADSRVDGGSHPVSYTHLYENSRPSSHAGLRDKMFRTCGHTPAKIEMGGKPF